jgi:hypothetical protein
MKHGSAVVAVVAVVLVVAVVGCAKTSGPGAMPGGGSGGGRGSYPPGQVASAINFHDAECNITRDDVVRARSGNDVTWDVSVKAPCELEGQIVEIVFTDGSPGDPSQQCQCADTVRNSTAKLKLHVKKHGSHQDYTYYIKAGSRTYHPRLEVDP